MLFVSPNFFAIFLPLALLLFYLTLYYSPALSISSILLASLIFYNFGGAQQMAVLLASIMINFLAATALSKVGSRTDQCRRIILFIGIFFNLSLLVYYKYISFIFENINLIFDLKLTHAPPLFPLGISFYTFTQIAFLADCFWRKGPRIVIPTHYLLFVTYFPHLIAGPIVHWREMMPQFARFARDKFCLGNFNCELFYRGTALFAMGLFKKVIIADQFAPIVETGYEHVARISFFDAWQTSLSYSFQLYFDFSGYSDMAIGISYLFGIELPVNFDSPYKSRSVREFWRRWHMTLSRWLRDYVYIPLGGNRGSEGETLRNLFLTFLVGGLWHGASWTFFIWGALHGLACCVEQMFQSRNDVRNPLIATSMTFLFVNFAWVFFRASDLSTAAQLIKSMIIPSLDRSELAPSTITYLCVCAVMCWGFPTSQAIVLRKQFFRTPLAAFIIGVILFLALLYQNSLYPSPFLYFNF